MGSPNRRRAAWLVGFGLVGCLLAVGCGDDDTTSDGTPVIVATTSIWADIADRVSCGGAEVDALIPAGGDPHSFEPSLADRSRMEAAALVVANGLELEERLDDTLDAVERAGTRVFRVGDHIDTLALGEPDAGEGSADPHVWFDPVRVAAAVPVLADVMVADGGLDAEVIRGCADEFVADLHDIDAEITALLAPIPAEHRLLVTSHDALGYFADRYGLEVIGAVIPSSSTLAESNPAALETLAELIDATGVTTIFGDRQGSSDASSALAARVGDVEVVELLTGTLGEPGSGADTYLGFLRTTAEAIAGGLG